jgi:hypothetical protein
MTPHKSDGGVNALFFGLTDDLARELLKPLAPFCSNVGASSNLDPCRNADVIFCSADREMVRQLRSIYPKTSIVVVSRYPEVSGWLDSIEAGATDYCAAPFDSTQMKWILESSRLVQARAGSPLL